MHWWIDWCSLCDLPRWAEPCAECGMGITKSLCSTTQQQPVIWTMEVDLSYIDSVGLLIHMEKLGQLVGQFRNKCTWTGVFSRSKWIYQRRINNLWIYHTCSYLAKISSGKQAALKRQEMLGKGCIAWGFQVTKTTSLLLLKHSNVIGIHHLDKKLTSHCNLKG